MNPHDNDNSDSNAPPESLLALQRRFAGHIRDPENQPPPDDVEDRRMAIYRRLFFGNLRNLMAKNFPVLRRLVSDEAWDGLIRQFMSQHRARTPMFTEIGREFVRFVEEHQPDELPPFARQLVHWEYLETIVRLDEADVEAAAADPDGDLLARGPVLNPTLQAASYDWPVHQIGPEFQPETPLEAPILLAAARRRNHRISFMRLNAVTGRLIALIGENPDHSGEDILRRIAGELGADDENAVIASGREMLERLRENELIVGTR